MIGAHVLPVVEAHQARSATQQADDAFTDGWGMHAEVSPAVPITTGGRQGAPDTTASVNWE